jgi:hypothetical protein
MRSLYCLLRFLKIAVLRTCGVDDKLRVVANLAVQEWRRRHHSSREQPLVLASTSSAFGNLQTLRLVLTLASRDPSLIPPPLMEQVQLVIQQALEIIEDTSRISPETRPEAIALAYAMRSSPELTLDIRHLTELHGISQAVAGTTLQHLDAAFVA